MVDSDKLPPENADTMTHTEASSGPLAVAKACIGIWSTVRQRDPPAPSSSSSSRAKTEHVRLITIVNSHFCEKARWALDLVEADGTNPYYYTEDAHPPGLHAYEPLKASNNVASITPMVVFHDDAETTPVTPTTVLWESTAILKKFMPGLYPAEIVKEIDAMEADLGRRLGSPLRCIAYHYLLKDLDRYHGTVVELSADPKKVAKIESTLFDKFLPRGLGDGIRKNLKVDEESAVASADELRSVFAEISNRLDESGGTYLMDRRGTNSHGFTAADLTFAALSYPFLRPPEMKHWLVADPTALPTEVESLSKELSATKAGEHVLKIYKEHRPVDKVSGVVEMKYADRNRTLMQWLFGN